VSETAGDYNRSIRIETRSGAKDTSGQLLDDWVVLHARLWAKVKGESGMATIRRAGENSGIMTTGVRKSLRIRYRTDIDVGMRAVLISTGVIFDILQVQHDDAGREYTDLVCEVGNNDG